MGNIVFLYKENNTENRDCVKYIDICKLKENLTGFDGKFSVNGACFSVSLKAENINYDNITTILAKEELDALCNPEGKDLFDIIAKLQSHENSDLFEQIQKDEEEWLMNEYNLDEDDIEDIFDEYWYPYHDRSVIAYVYSDAYDLGYDVAESCGYLTESAMERYFDFKQFGEDLVSEGDSYYEIADGRIVYFNF